MLTRLQLTNFRSYSYLDLELAGNVTVIFGPNAVGKTNLLESIFVMSTSKSFRAHDAELVNKVSDFYRIDARSGDQRIEVRYLQTAPKTTAKQIKIDGVRKRQTELLGMQPVTLFEPNDLLMLTGSPSLRRRYIDIVLSQIDPAYVKNLSLYNHLIKQRNSLLHRHKKIGRTTELGDQLFVYDLQLADPAHYLRQKRLELMNYLNPIISEYYSKISDQSDKIELAYNFDEKNQDDYLARLSHDQARDIAVGYTTSGPHRDDLRIFFKAQPISHVASRGEARTAVLALKLAEMDYVEMVRSIRPIFLLDDVFSELDSNRRALLVDLLERQQSVITTTDIHDIISKDYQLIDLSRAKNG